MVRPGTEDVPTCPDERRPDAVWTFAEHTLDADRFELRRGGVRVPVQRKPLALLFYLARHRDRLVPRDELVAYLWPDVVVSDDALFHAVKVAREAVGDRGRHQRVIATVRGVGFRFVAEVEERAARPPRRAPPATSDARRESQPLLGREALLERILAAFDEAARGRGRALLLEGEAGVGKTRLLDEIAELARGAGARVVRGVAREAGGPAFAPWSQALEGLLAASSDAELAALAGGASGPWLAQLVPSLCERLPSLGGAEAVELVGAESRWCLFEAIARVLAVGATKCPMVVLLDDLHWADVASLRLVEFLLGDLHRHRILLVGAHRDERFPAEHALSTLAGELARLDAGARLRVDRLSRELVAELLEALSGSPPPAALAEAVHARTAGNPFFVVQIARELGPGLANGNATLASVPPAVRQVVAGRLARLREDTRDVLALAAVAGAELDMALLQRAFERGPDAVLDALEEALAARLLEEAPGAVGRLRFVHALIQETICAELPALRRARLHRALGEALESLSARDHDPPVAAIAHHFAEAAAVGAGAAAARWAIRAGDTAMRQMAYEQAAAHYERAVSLVDPASLAADARYALLYALGRARHFGIGDFVRARESFLGAAAAARALGDPDRLADAALAYAAIPQSSVLEVEEPCRAVLEEALAAQPPGAAKTRARLLARLGAFLANDPRRQDEAIRIAARALEAARVVGGPHTILEALLAVNRTLRLKGLAPPEERLAVSSESVALAVAARDPVLESIAHGQRISPLLELGRGAAADAEVDAYSALAARHRIPAFGWLVPVLRAMQQLLRGELARVEATALSALPVAARVPDSVAPGVLAALLFLLRREQGRLAEAEGPMRGLVARYAGVPGPRAWLAFLLAECGRREEARREIGPLVDEGLSALAGTEAWRACLGMLAEACATLGDAPRAAQLYEELLPVARHCLVLGDGVLCVGPAGRVLGRLAALLGRWDEAEAHFAQSLELCETLGSPPFAARTQLDRARALLRRGRPEDCLVADGLLRAAERAGAKMGMTRLLEEARAVRSGRSPSA
jgi:DNA-binding winged helix-turn-helix (wHTH) protein/tetratricopeptide (TPR) repeat protein